MNALAKRDWRSVRGLLDSRLLAASDLRGYFSGSSPRAKNNLGPKAPSLAYKTVGARANPAIGVIEWLSDVVAFSPDEVLDNSPRRKHGQTRNDAERGYKTC
jgi:hypothetical protein